MSCDVCMLLYFLSNKRRLWRAWFYGMSDLCSYRFFFLYPKPQKKKKKRENHYLNQLVICLDFFFCKFFIFLHHQHSFHLPFYLICIISKKYYSIFLYKKKILSHIINWWNWSRASIRRGHLINAYIQHETHEWNLTKKPVVIDRLEIECLKWSSR